MQSYTTFKVEKVLNLKRTRLQEWLNRKFIKPSIQESTGLGSKALFSHEDLYCIKLFDELLKLGIQREDIARIIYFLQADAHLPEIPRSRWKRGHLHYLVFSWDSKGFVENIKDKGWDLPKSEIYLGDSIYGLPEHYQDNTVIRLTIDLTIIRRMVDRQIEKGMVKRYLK
jgi:hypothetical protein